MAKTFTADVAIGLRQVPLLVHLLACVTTWTSVWSQAFFCVECNDVLPLLVVESVDDVTLPIVCRIASSSHVQCRPLISEWLGGRRRLRWHGNYGRTCVVSSSSRDSIVWRFVYLVQRTAGKQEEQIC